MQREDLERKAFYLQLKQTEENAKDQYYQPFGLQREKKRKQTLTNMLWMQNQLNALAEIDASAKIVAELVKPAEKKNAQPSSIHIKLVDNVQVPAIEVRRQLRISKAVLEVARSNFQVRTNKR